MQKSLKTTIAIICTPLILLFAHRVKIPFREKLVYFFDSIITFAPIVFVFTALQTWFDSNSVMGASLIGALVCNALVGVYFHLKKNDTFDISDFIKKNIEMIVYTFVVHYCLYILHLNIADALPTNIFLALINVTSLLFPISEIAKKVFILSDGKHPPEFVMTSTLR